MIRVRILSALAPVIMCLAGHSSFAYHLGDHQAITEQAFKEISACFPKSAALLSLSWLVSGDREEDTDLVTKWLFFSHYYHPYKHLHMWRADSSARVEDLTPKLVRASTGPLDAYEADELGHLIHHFQDATVPPHVVPVAHALWDGFETYDFHGDISTGLNCEQISGMPVGDPQTILRETAILTLKAVREQTVDVTATVNGTVNHLSAGLSEAFWTEAKDNGFGHYGYFGNNFGSSKFSSNGVTYAVPADFYAVFKRQQMRLAVLATIRGLMWQLGPQLMREHAPYTPIAAGETAHPAG